MLNRLQLPTDIVFLIVLWRLRMKLSLRDLAEILLLRGLVFSHERVSTLSGLRNTVDYTEKRECPVACTNERF